MSASSIDRGAPRRGRVRGRRSLSGQGDSPQIRVRVPADLYELVELRADEQGTTVSGLVRTALADHLRPAPDTAISAPIRVEERVQWELHRALLRKIVDIEQLRTLARRNIAKSRKIARSEQAQRWLDEWATLLDGPVEQLVWAMLRSDDHGVDLRQMSPFAGALDQDERIAAIKRARSRASH